MLKYLSCFIKLGDVFKINVGGIENAFNRRGRAAVTYSVRVIIIFQCVHCIYNMHNIQNKRERKGKSAILITMI